MFPDGHIMGKEKSELAVYGYIHQHKNIMVPIDIINICHKYFDDMYYWTIPIGTFKNTPYNKCLTSTPISVQDIEFVNHIYPNGEGDDKNSVNNLLGLKELQLPQYVDKIIFLGILYCKELNIEKNISAVYTINNRKSCYGWAPWIMKMNDVNNLNIKSLTFGVYIDILQIDYSNSVDCKIENKINYIKPTIFNKYFKYEWKISDKLLTKFKSARMRKRFDSDHFNNGCWYFGIYPNGMNKSYPNSVVMGTKILKLPSNMEKITAVVQLIVILNDNKSILHSKALELSYVNDTIIWPFDLISTEQMQNCKSLKFVTETNCSW